MIQLLDPLQGAGKTIQTYGANRRLYRALGQLGHNGLDLAAEPGTPIYAAAAGTIIHAGWSHDHPWLTHHAGIATLIHHGDYITGYAHQAGIAAVEGQPVAAGELIGYVGRTGTAGTDHLHFELLAAKPDFGNGYAGRLPLPPFTPLGVGHDPYGNEY